MMRLKIKENATYIIVLKIANSSKWLPFSQNLQGVEQWLFDIIWIERKGLISRGQDNRHKYGVFEIIAYLS